MHKIFQNNKKKGTIIIFLKFTSIFTVAFITLLVLNIKTSKCFKGVSNYLTTISSF